MLLTLRHYSCSDFLFDVLRCFEKTSNQSENGHKQFQVCSAVSSVVLSSPKTAIALYDPPHVVVPCTDLMLNPGGVAAATKF